MLFPGHDMPAASKAQRERKTLAFKKWAAKEDERVRRQRIYLTTLKGPLCDAMVKRMLERAWELLDASECEAADALLEFVPEHKAWELLDAFFWDDAPAPPAAAPVQWDFHCGCGRGYLDPRGDDEAWTCRDCGQAVRRARAALPPRMKCVGDLREVYVPPASMQRWRERRLARREIRGRGATG